MADTGFLSPGTMAQGGSGPTSWSNPSNAATSNNAYATFINVTGSSSTLTATNFGSSVPSGATINGIEVTIERKSSSGSAHKDFTVQLVKGGTASGTNKADTATFYGTSDATITYGGASDLWGNTLTVSDVNATNFGVVFQCNNTAAALNTCSVDAFSLKIYYTTTTSYTLTVTQGTVTYTGQSVGVKVAHKLTVANGAVTYTGQSVSLKRGYKLTVSPATVAYAGQGVGLSVSRKMTVSHGAITYAGQSVGMAKGTVGYTLTVSPATITYAGQSVGMRVGRKLTVTNGTFSYVGQTVRLLRGRKLTVSNGAITYSGKSLTLKVGRKLTAGCGLIGYTGQAVTLRRSGTIEYSLTVSPGMISYAGQGVGLRVGRRLTVAAGRIIYTGGECAFTIGGLYDHEATVCREVHDMRTASEICNMALGLAGAGSIRSLTDSTPQGKACYAYYQEVRRELLMSVPWPFARRQVALALLGAAAGTEENPDGAGRLADDGWEYTYAYPCDCLEIEMIKPSSDGEQAGLFSNVGNTRDAQNTIVPFVEGTWYREGGGIERIISTNKQAAVMVFKADIKDAAVMPADFVSILQHKLAARLAAQLTGKMSSVQALEAQADKLYGIAYRKYVNEYVKADIEPMILDFTPDSIRARG